MKKFSLFLVTIVLSVLSIAQRNAEGDWLGTIDVGVKLRLVVHITKGADGKLTATLDSPDQGAKGIQASSVLFTGDSLHLKVDAIKGGFNGKFVSDTTIDGVWSQGPGKIPLTINRTKNIIALNRPQTPKAPFNYRSEDVEYSNTDKTVQFGGTLTLPAGTGKYPAAILISGSGQQDRDESLFEHKPFAVIADYLTKQGFAVLRIDDRGIGKTKGIVENTTSDDYANDVEAGIAYLRARPEIDINKLGLIGHSEGGLIASLIASRRKDINFLVLLASPGVKGSTLMSGQVKAVLTSQGLPEEPVTAYQSLYNEIANISATTSDTSTAMVKSIAFYNNWKKTVSASSLTMLGLADSLAAAKTITSLVNAFSSPWMKYFLNSDPQPLLQKTNAKVLALNGEKDIQVLHTENLAGISAALKKSKSKVFEVKMLPGLNHLFQNCKLCSVNEYAQLEETFSTDALKVMGDWLQKNVQK